MTRKFTLIAALAVIGLVAAEAYAQQPGGRRPGGFRPGGFSNDPISLLEREAIRKELEVEEDQVADIRKLREEMNNELADLRRKLAAKYEERLDKVLLPQQVKRLSEISIQLQGNRALQDAKVVKKLGITEDQQKKMAAKREEYRTKMRVLFSGDGDRTERFQKMRELQQESGEAVLSVLSATQRSQFTAMKGEEFDRSQLFQRRGPGGRPGGDGNKRPPRKKRPDTN